MTFHYDIGLRITIAIGDVRETKHLFQRFSAAVQLFKVILSVLAILYWE